MNESLFEDSNSIGDNEKIDSDESFDDNQEVTDYEDEKEEISSPEEIKKEVKANLPRKFDLATFIKESTLKDNFISSQVTKKVQSSLSKMEKKRRELPVSSHLTPANLPSYARTITRGVQRARCEKLREVLKSRKENTKLMDKKERDMVLKHIKEIDHALQKVEDWYDVEQVFNDHI